MIPADIVREVLLRADIVQVIGDYVTLKRAGQSLKGLCPFHGEKTPSFHVTPSKSMYYCFGCGQGGNAIDFLMRIEGLSFPEAVERMGARFGVEVHSEQQDREAVDQARAQRAKLLDLIRVAENFFRAQLDAPDGAEARAYLDARGVQAPMRQLFRLGYAPASWDGLLSELRHRRVELELAMEAGLIASRRDEDGQADERRGHYDRFRHRIIFPIIDAFSNTLGFGGRALEAQAPAKYLNSPETSLFVKGRVLYGLHAAKEAARRDRHLLLVEGNFDVITMAQAGFMGTVAPMGTALTEEQVKLAARYCERITVIFDGDAAGRRAAFRSVAALQSVELDARVVYLPDGEDPDSFLRHYGAPAMTELLDSAPGLLRWAVDQSCEEALAQPIEARGGQLEKLGELLGTLRQAHTQQHYLLEAARKLGYAPHELAKLLQLAPAGKEKPARLVESPASTSSPARLDPLERELLGRLLESAARREEFLASDGKLLLEDHRVCSILDALDATAQTADELSTLIAKLPDAGLRSLALEALATPSAVGEAHVEDWYRGLVARLTERWINKQTRELGQRLGDALARNDIEEQERLAKLHRRLIELREQARNDRKINWLTLQSEA